MYESKQNSKKICCKTAEIQDSDNIVLCCYRNLYPKNEVNRIII